MSDNFDMAPKLQQGDLTLLPLIADDFGGLSKAASDPEIWAGHPSRDRYLPKVFQPYFDFLLTSGGTLVTRRAGQIIGCSKFYVAPHAPDTMSIGFTFLTTDHWGGDMNRRVKTLQLSHIFHSYDQMTFHIDPTNIRSQRATAKLGAVYQGNVLADLAGAEVEWMEYVLTKSDWVSNDT